MKRIRLGMVGGGAGAFIGPVHRIAARLDDRYTLVAAALSSNPERALASGRAIGLPDERIYADWAEMARAEAARPDGIEAVSITTPNHLHLPVARAFLAAGIHVICDKPLGLTLAQAREFAAFARTAPARFFLTHNYSAYPLVRQARDMVAEGKLGHLRIINMEYLQGWLSDDHVAGKQAEWRADPARAGLGGALGDIGTHAYHLANFVTGLRADRLSADLQSFGAERALDDNAHIHFRFPGGVAGSGWISQVAVGQECGLRLRVVGTAGMLEFFQEDPNRLLFWRKDEPLQVFTRGGPRATQDVRVPAGHPEGYLEAFASLYRDIADALAGDAAAAGRVPSLDDGLEGMAFIAAAVASHAADGAWIALDEYRNR
ncbi:MAG: oxidoreductase [Rhodobacterales bacterium CG2_30_65_12]|nr:MAG: oxidoreductase [Rhodobacterales bacterium CG2_30_65_12]